MKHRVPADIDTLMWTVAEEGNVRARDEFDARYPEHRLELVRRIEMVKGLKQGRPDHVEAAAVPRFRPAPKPTVNKRMVVWTSGLVLASVALASYTVVSLLSTPSATPKHVSHPVVPEVKFVTPSATEPTMANSLPHANEPPPESPAPKPVETPAYLKPQDVTIERAPLQTVLKLLAAQGGLKIDFDPGMPNPDVAIHYQGKTVIEMLEDLGRQYAFTPFDQGNGSVIVVPVREGDPTARPTIPAHTKSGDGG